MSKENKKRTGGLSYITCLSKLWEASYKKGAYDIKEIYKKNILANFQYDNKHKDDEIITFNGWPEKRQHQQIKEKLDVERQKKIELQSNLNICSTTLDDYYKGKERNLSEDEDTSLYFECQDRIETALQNMFEVVSPFMDHNAEIEEAFIHNMDLTWMKEEDLSLYLNNLNKNQLN